MTVATQLNLDRYCADVAARAKRASARLAVTKTSVKDHWLRRSAKLLRERGLQIEQANALDLAAAPGSRLTVEAIDRLRRRAKGLE